MSQQEHVLSASRREIVGKKNKGLRKQGLVPAVLYGYGVEPTKLQMDAKSFELMYRDAGGTALVGLSVEDATPVQVFVQDVQRDPIKRTVRHVDFHAVNLRVEVTTDIPIALVGESPAVRNNVGLLLRGLDTVSVQALPADLPQQIEISVEGLAEVDDTIHVSDLPSDGKYQILTDPAEMLVKITPQEIDAEAEDAAAAEAVEEEAPEATEETGEEQQAE
jgi:large subunit ribosomal protein L25